MIALFAETGPAVVTATLVTLSMYAHACRFIDAENMSFHLITITRVDLEQTKRFRELLQAIRIDLRTGYYLSFEGRSTVIHFWKVDCFRWHW